jgi:hypothetical protein
MPICGGVTGHPILISSRAADTLVSDSGEGGLRSAMQRCGYEIKYVPVSDRGILHDADTPEDYRALLAYHNRQILRPVVDIQLAAEKPFFDSRMPCCCSSSTTPAPCVWPAADADILQLRLEPDKFLGGGAGLAAGEPVSGRHRRQPHHAHPEGADLLERYRKFSSQLKTDAEELFEKHFGDVFSV